MVVLILFSGCSDDSSPTKPDNDLENALENYWETTTEMSEHFTSMNEVLDEIEDLFTNSRSSLEEIEVLVDEYYDMTAQAGAYFDRLLAYEEAIRAYGDSDRGFFTDLARATARGVYNTARNTVVNSGRMVRSCYQVVTFQRGIREVLRDPESGVPIVSSVAQRWQDHYIQTDYSITQSILAGDDQEGNINIDAIPGETLQEKAQNYMQLSDDDPLKKETRQFVHYWDPDYNKRCVDTIKEVTKDKVMFIGEKLMGDIPAEITKQMLETGQDESDTGAVDLQIQDVDTSTVITRQAMVIIQKENQPTDESKIVIAADVDPQTDLELPSGDYSILTIAEDYVRAVESDYMVMQGMAEELLVEMYDRIANSLIIEDIVVEPVQPVMNNVVDLRAVAVSVIGSPVSFNWSVSGGEYTDLSALGVVTSFIPTEHGDYSITVTASDEFGNTRSKTVTIEVSNMNLSVIEYDLSNETFEDIMINPGEDLAVELILRNDGADDLLGNVTVRGWEGTQVTDGTTGGVSISTSGTQSISFDLHLPANWSKDYCYVDLEFDDTASGSVFRTLVYFDVEFYVELDPIDSPHTDRVLPVSGKVANPSLNQAWIALDNDFDQLFQVSLINGEFSRDIPLQGTTEPTDHILVLIAESGSWQEQDAVQFSSDIEAASLRVTLTWDTNNTDVDLWVTDPFGERCYYGNRFTQSGLSLDMDVLYGYGPETITGTDLPGGDYFVQVHYYSDYEPDFNIPTNATVAIVVNEGQEDEQRMTYYGNLYGTEALWNVTTITLEESEEQRFTELKEFTTLSPSEMPAKQ
jgi:hypothetical protein